MDWTGAADLEGSIAKWEADRDVLSGLIAAIDSDLAGMRSEVERRKINLLLGLDLRVGDKLTMSQACHDEYVYSDMVIQPGEIVEIISFSEAGVIVYAPGEAPQVIDLEFVKDMREAYLKAQESK